MRVAYLDCVGGISGDMFVGALLDAGWPEERLRASVAWLGGEIAALRVVTREHRGFSARAIEVEPAPAADHHHRDWSMVRRMLTEAPLAEAVRERALAVFRRLAEAEGRAHGRPAETVHFHEVGAIDALVDIVGACAGLTELGVERLFHSPLLLGKGQVTAAHGEIPLPAPATAFLIEGRAVRWSHVEGERTTPTGAALATTLGSDGPPPPMILERVGSGAGSRSYPDTPNLARLFIGIVSPAATIPAGRPSAAGDQVVSLEGGPDLPAAPPFALSGIPAWGWEWVGEGAGDHHPASPASPPSPASPASPAPPGRWGQVAVLETQIDDAPAEELADLAERLREAGALEVMIDPLVMKKGRLGSRLTLIARPEREPELVTLLLEESTTLGVRRRLEWRRELARRAGEVATPFGPIRVKLAWRRGVWVGEPEYESCRAAARAHGAGLRTVWRAAIAALTPLAPGDEARREPPPDAPFDCLDGR
ncbi:MAG: nickel pincer cofactor biosynthesis protein LarC [Candidatus Eisenbacteria sp.]|nr:nickel pincer cofactor biosynthesis protein LarC [Candidatus Eisenbacteria bacterium]